MIVIISFPRGGVLAGSNNEFALDMASLLKLIGRTPDYHRP